MPFSTAKRESLIPKIYLFYIALLLGLAFYLLKPSGETFSFADPTATLKRDEQVDALDMAYLKARSATGDLPAAEIRNVALGMIRAQRWEEALSLLASRPDVKLDRSDRFLLDLETAKARLNDAANQTVAATQRAQLLSQLTTLINDASLHEKSTLLRASQVSETLQQAQMSAALYMLLANKDPARSGDWFEKCATVLAAHQYHSQAITCFRSSIAQTASIDKRFDLSMQMISQLQATGDLPTRQHELEKLIGKAPMNIGKLSTLAGHALAAERADLAYPLFARLADLDRTKQVFWLEKAAKWSLASNLPGLSAEYVLSIAKLSPEEARPALAERRQQLLRAAGRNEDALQALRERLAFEPNSAELLQEAIALARQMGLRIDAMDWNSRLLKIRPYDLAAMKRQIQFAQSTRQLEDARYWARRALAQQPDDAALHQQLAQLEEWTGNPEAALPHWNWLAKHAPNERTLRERARLAELTWQLGVAAEALDQLASRQPLSDTDLLKMMDLYEQDGRPSEAAAALQRYMAKHGTSATLQRQVALLHQRHLDYDNALAGWEELAASYGHSDEETLNRMELHWRLKQPELALQIAERLRDVDTAKASEFQLKLIAEIGWRYRKPEIILAAGKDLEVLDVDEDQRIQIGRRLIQAMQDSENYPEAVAQAENFWRETGHQDFLMQATQLVFRHDLYPQVERYLDATDELQLLRRSPDYWDLAAAYHVRNIDPTAAHEAFDYALQIEPENISAISGLMWLHIGQNDNEKLQQAVARYLPLAADEKELWAPFALASLKLGEPEKSLPWFSRIMERDEHDYNILLTFADALEQTGQAGHAFKVRQYAVQKLRPLIVASTGAKTDELASSYVSLLIAHGATADKERWVQRLLKGVPEGDSQESFWREELAISWYLSTQRHDYAKVLMTRIHEDRLATPVWQDLALAMREDNLPRLAEILASGKRIEPTDRLAALTKLGQENEAFALARQVMKNGIRQSDRSAARSQYVALRNYRPGYYAGTVQQKDFSDLSITETSLSLRHTPSGRSYGFGVDYAQNQLGSDVFDLGQTADETDVAVTAWYGDSRSGGTVTTGVVSNDIQDSPYLRGRYYKRNRRGTSEFTADATVNAPSTGSSELRIAALEDQAALGYETRVGAHEFLRLGGKVNSIRSRSEGEPVSTGVAASLEVGRKGSFGSNSWSMGLLATGLQNDVDADLPTELQLTPSTTIDSILVQSAGRLAITGLLQRGGIRAPYPQTGSPRYHLRASLGHNWPFRTVGFQVEAGAGFRVLGDDELSLEFAHDTQAELEGSGTSSNSLIGIQYRSHF